MIDFTAYKMKILKFPGFSLGSSLLSPPPTPPRFFQVLPNNRKLILSNPTAENAFELLKENTLSLAR